MRRNRPVTVTVSRTARDPRHVACYLDLENLLYQARAGCRPATTRAAFDALLAELDQLGDRVSYTAACDTGLIYTLIAAAAGRVIIHPVTPGVADAADDRLIGLIEAGLPASVGTVVIGSGDGKFAPLVAALQTAGVQVIVAADPSTLSRALALAADQVLDTSTVVTPATSGQVLAAA